MYSTVKATLAQAASTHRQFQMGAEGETAPAQTHAQPVVREEPPEKTAPVARPELSESAPPAKTIFSGVSLPAGVLRDVPRPGQREIKTYNKMVDTLASEGSAIPYKTSAPKPVSEWGLDIEPTATDAEAQPGQTPPLHAQAEEKASREKAQEPPRQTSFAPEDAEEAAPVLTLVGEVFKTYILAQQGDVLCVIDKHAAHERIIYEQLAAKHGSTDAQQLLAPVNLTLGAAEKDALLQNGEALAAAGIEVDDFGGNEVLVRGVPADVEPDSVTDLVTEVAGRLAVNGNDNLNEKTEWVLHSVACRAAVKAGDRTQPEELLCLASDILAGKVPPFCPHGRPVVLEIPRKELEKQFGRLG